MANKTTLELYDSKEDYFKDIWARYDTDKSLIYMDDYTIKDANDKALPKRANAISVTLNLAANQARIAARKLIKSEKQLVIEGNKKGRALSDKETSLIEKFANAVMDEANDRLKKRFIPSLKDIAANHLVTRGAHARRIWSYTSGGVYIPDILPLDMRYVRYEVGNDGLNWAGYQSTRTSGTVYSEYFTKENKLRSKVESFGDSDTDVEVVAIYNGEVEEVWAGGELISIKEHKFGYTPIVIQVVGTGFMLMDEGYLEHWGESILEMNRKLYGEANRQASVEQSLMMRSLLPSYAQEKKNTTDETVDYPPVQGELVPLPGESKLQAIPTPDLNMASRMAVSRLNSVLTQAGYNDVDLGNMGDASAVTISTQAEIREDHLLPFLDALSGLDEQTIEMVIDQVKAGGYSVESGRRGMTLTVKPSDLDGDYTIRYVYMSKDRKQEIANLAMAQVAKAMGLPDEHIIRDIYKYENPAELIAMMETQKAERDDPVIGMVRRAHALVDEAEGRDTDVKNAKLIESMLLTDTAVNVLRNRYNPQPQQIPETMQPGQENKPEGSSPSLVPLMGAGRSTTRAMGANVE